MSSTKVPIGVCRLLTLFAPFALAACAVGPDYRSPSIPVPAQWAEAPAATHGRPDLAAWWKRFDDRLMTRFIDMAVEGNLDVASAKARIREARALRDAAAAGLLPEVDASTSFDRSRSSIAEGVPASVSSLYKAGFDASWDLDLFGATARTVEADTDGVEAADQDLRSTLLTLVADVARYYVDARGYQARIALARQSKISQDQTVVLTQRQFAAGTSNGADLAKAQAQALSTQSNIPLLESAYKQDVHRIGVLLGIGPDSALAAMSPARSMPLPRSSVAVGIPADVIRFRPDVRKAERQLAQQTAMIGADEAQLYPDVTLSGTVGVSAFKIGDITKAASRTWSFGPSVSVPVFDAGKRRSAVTAQQAVRDQYYAAYQTAVLSAMEGVENAIVALAKQRAAADSLGKSADRYKEADRIARVLFTQGLSSFLDVLDSDRSLYTSQDTFIQNQVSLAEDHIALFKALGGGWDGTVESGRPAVVDATMGPHVRSPETPSLLSLKPN